MDTVCHPTKDRQTALHDFCRKADLVLAIGGKNSNNTAQLARTARHLNQSLQIKRILSKSLQRRHLTDRPSPLFIRKPLIEVDIGRFRKI